MSREESILVKRLRKLVVLTSTYSVFLGLFLVYLIMAPIYVIEGVIKGYVALAHHELTFYGTPVRCDALFSAGFLSLSALILSAYLLLVGASTLYLFYSGRNFNVGVRWLFGGALSALAFSGLFLALIKNVISVVAAELNLDLDQVTSAGILYLGSSRVSVAYPAGYLLPPITVFVAILTYVILAVATYLHTAIVGEYGLTKGCPTEKSSTGQ